MAANDESGMVAVALSVRVRLATDNSAFLFSSTQLMTWVLRE